jgi:hypothetical protein
MFRVKHSHCVILEAAEIKSSERKVTIYQSNRRYIPEEFNLQQYRCENLKFIIITNTVEPGYNDIGLCDTSSIAPDILSTD